MAAPEAVSTRGMKNQVRIRGPKPDVCFHAKSLDEMETLLRKHIDLCKDKPVPETVYAQFIFDNSVVFSIKEHGEPFREHFQHLMEPQYDKAPWPLAVTEAVAQVPDTKLKLRRQRAVGRAILKSISEIDGFQYFEKEAWDTKHADGYRFKYLCKDSYQNKDRAANKGRKSTDPVSFQSLNGNGSASATPTAQPFEHHPGDHSPHKGDVSEWFKKHGLTPPAAESPARLPTYDCKGSIFVKFSSSQGVVDVVYQHLPMHNATNERAPDPVPEKPSRASLPAQVNNGTLHDDSADPMDTSELPSHHATPRVATPVTAPVSDNAASASAPAAAATKGKKRKRTSIKPPRESLVEAETSDVDALDDEFDLENAAPPPPLVDPNFEPDPGDADLWRPSVVTLVPGLKTLMKQPIKKGGTGSGGASKTAAAPEIEDSSASESDFEGPGTGKKAAPKKKASAKPKAASSASSKPQAAATNGTTGNSSSTIDTKHGNVDGGENGSDTRASRKQRSKTGCWTCRGRKLKCDEARPACGQCARSRPPRDCSWPDDEDDLSDAVMT